jgi:hypothetical protein
MPCSKISKIEVRQMQDMMGEQELFYEADTRKHQKLVADVMVKSAKEILDRAMLHDRSKFEDAVERKSYVEPVYALNTEKVPYGSERYKELTDAMGEGWLHHKANNDHHPEHWATDHPFEKMNVFQILEMCCDWIAASKRRGNNPILPLARMRKDFGMTEQLSEVIANTILVLNEDL